MYRSISSNNYAGDIAISSTVIYDGSTYVVTSIGNYAFNNCNDLTSIAIPNSVTTIGSYAFRNCSGLTSVTIPNSVTSIGSEAFFSCSGLTSITIGGSVTNIGKNTFFGCSGLTSVHITDLAAWCNISFGNDFSNPLYYAHHLFLNGEEVTDVAIPNSMTSIGSYAFSGCSGLTSVTIPNSVTSIGDAAFAACSGLTSVIIPNGVASIGESAFSGCSDLASIALPDSMVAISNYAFRDCSSLKLVKIPDNLKIIETGMFENCHSLVSVVIPNSVESIEGFAFQDCINLTSVTIPNSVKHISRYAFRRAACRQTQEDGVAYVGNWVYEYTRWWETDSIRIDIKEGTVGIADFAFCDCHRIMSSVTIPEGVAYIGDDAFEGCSILSSFTLPKSVVEIGQEAFRNCEKLESIHIPTNVTAIGRDAFKGCRRLSSVTIGNHVTDIGENIFEDCDSLWLPAVISASSISVSNNIFVEDVQPESSLLKIQIEDGKEVKGNNAVFTGLEPSKTYNVSFLYSSSPLCTSKQYRVEDIKLNTVVPQVTKSGTAIVAAETNLGEEETNAGFEWRKTDAPDDMPSRNGVGAIYDGTMEAVVKNLDASSYYRVRPFYKSNAGNEYYGEWVAFDPSDFSYCEPAIHTYANTKVEGSEVQLTGYVMEGTDDILEQGFEVWVIIFTDGSKTRRAETKGEVMTVPATGQRMTATLSGLEYGTTYAYRSYVKTSSQTYYGEEITFKTGENPNGIEDVIAEESVSPQSIRHGVYTLQGVKVSEEPTDLKALPQGIYIVNGKKVYVK
ncbi:MAG: leucine-rich repeat domain-containing protein [Bacteroidaceae bacterium]|nr:leucine-rich repeat domain-containing protein [Bacteroidaceae bacterium]